MEYMANDLFARANQPLIVMLIERRKFNRDLLQGCDEWPRIRRDTGAGHRFGLIKTGSDLAGALPMKQATALLSVS